MKHIVLEIFFPGYFVFNGNGSSNEIFLITFYTLYSFYVLHGNIYLFPGAITFILLFIYYILYSVMGKVQ